MQQFAAWLNGRKTYITALLMGTYALLGWYLQVLTPQQAMQYLFAALGMVGLRSALQKVIDASQP